jgi:RND family efflux transporter MFP subunit
MVGPSSSVDGRPGALGCSSSGVSQVPQSVRFAISSRVAKDDLLFTIQQDQYIAQLKQAEAQVAAQKAAVHHAKTEVARYTGLLKQDAATQTSVDHWEYEAASSTAALASAQAQVDLAKLNLGYTQIRAPFTGRIGRHLVDPGNHVGSTGQQTSLAEIEQIDPLYVYFTIDERELLRVMQGRRGPTPEGLAAKEVPMSFGLLDEDGFPHEGKLDFASVGVSPTTGTLQVRGVFPNPDGAVLPGLFVRVRVSALAPRDALLVRGDAVSFDQQGEYVLVVNDRNVVERRGVKTGQQFGEQLAVVDGLKADDRVVVDGILQAIPGRTVTPQPAAPAAP